LPARVHDCFDGSIFSRLFRILGGLFRVLGRLFSVLGSFLLVVCGMGSLICSRLGSGLLRGLSGSRLSNCLRLCGGISRGLLSRGLNCGLGGS